MASDLQPPGDRKRVKVYELKDNDWFDRGTGFCTGRILDVSSSPVFAWQGVGYGFHPNLSSHSSCLRDGFACCCRRMEEMRMGALDSVLFLANLASRRRMNRGYSSSRKKSLFKCFWKQKSPRMAGIRSSKVGLLRCGFKFNESVGVC